MTDRPETYYTLPADFAAALGQSIAAFGWLEEVMKRAIYALDRARLAQDLNPDEMERWTKHMNDVADDSMGTVIDQLDAAMRRHPGVQHRLEVTDELQALKQFRNLFCHASWNPTKTEGRWHPAFVHSKTGPFGDDFSAEEINAVSQRTHVLGERILKIMRRTGYEGKWPGDDG